MGAQEGPRYRVMEQATDHPRAQRGALRRLRCYFPDAYAALSGPNLKKRQAFEMAALERGQE